MASISSPNAAPTQPTAKPLAKASADTNRPFDYDIDAINARLRDAYESLEYTF